MTTDPIVEEIRSIREELARRYDYDLDAIVRALQNASSDAGRRLVSLLPRSVPEQKARNLG